MKWALTRDGWRQISAEVRRWLAESIRLRGQAEVVYFCEKDDREQPSMPHERWKS
jgi:hypothetical protein